MVLELEAVEAALLPSLLAARPSVRAAELEI